MTDEQQLLRRYAEEDSEAAFAELVSRHVNLVYATAMRRTNGNTHLARDVAQLVFTDLARKAGSLPGRVVLAGWLHRATRHAAAHLLRTEHRRQAREQEAMAMKELELETHPDWEHIRPLLDEALDRLSREDRDAVLLRFFEQRSLAEVGAALGGSDEAARKRVNRALEKLRAHLARRGASTSAATFALVLSANGVHAAPAAWASTLASTSLAGGATTAATSFTFLKLMTITKTHIGSVVTGALVLTATTAIFLASNHRSEAVPTLNSATFQVVPGIGVGPVKIGMALSEVEKLLGKAGPDGLYTAYGLAVETDPADTNHVSHIMLMGRQTTGASDGQFPANFQDFAGTTKEGIHLGSTGPDVLQAFGKPDGSDVPAVGWEMLNYRSLGLSVSLQNGHVRGIVVGPPADKTMTFATDAKPQDVPSDAVPTTAWVIEPKVGIGPLKFGMALIEVEHLLGRPVQIANGVNYEYYQDGITLAIGKKNQKVFGMSVIGTGNAEGWMASATGLSYQKFTGATVGGIRIGSSRAEVVHALGQPGTSTALGNLELLSYAKSALTVRLENQQVTELDLLVH